MSQAYIPRRCTFCEGSLKCFLILLQMNSAFTALLVVLTPAFRASHLRFYVHGVRTDRIIISLEPLSSICMFQVSPYHLLYKCHRKGRVSVLRYWGLFVVLVSTGSHSSQLMTFTSHFHIHPQLDTSLVCFDLRRYQQLEKAALSL